MSLAFILRGFTLVQKRLEKFQAKNGKQIIKMQNELHVKEREQERAAAVAKKLEEFLA
jgi:hypothetical protein